MTDSRLTKRDPKGSNRADVPLHSREDYIDCAKCGKVMRESRFLGHMAAHREGAVR